MIIKNNAFRDCVMYIDDNDKFIECSFYRCTLEVLGELGNKLVDCYVDNCNVIQLMKAGDAFITMDERMGGSIIQYCRFEGHDVMKGIEYK